MEERGRIPENASGGLHRRSVLKALSVAGIGSAVFGRAVMTLAGENGDVTTKMLRQAEWISGLTLTDEKRDLMLEGLTDATTDYEALRAVTLDNGVPPAVQFSPDPFGAHGAVGSRGHVEPIETTAGRRPASHEDLAFLPVTELAALIRRRKISSRELTDIYLDRLERYDPTLRCVISLTRDLAIKQAERADREIAAGRYRGVLHGIPWGAKDLLAVPGYRTTWGATPYKAQERPEMATVARRLEEAGAVLVAKTSLGALAWGDVWFDATTKNPWNKEQGSSGSSAGSASATAAGLVGFAIGTETLGSIVSPSTRCGATGLRPTFGRVSRYGAMALSWSMDKIGPITRSVEDCALVLGAVHGADGLDPSAVDRPFSWPLKRDVRTLRVGFVPELFDAPRGEEMPGESVEDRKRKADAAEWATFDRRTLATLKEMGLDLVPIALPSTYPIGALGLILTAEAATAFDELTRSGKDDQLVRQIQNAWPNVFRLGQMVPAVEYLRANRIRQLVMRELDEVMTGIDVYITPSFGGNNLLMTNLTGHPQVVLPNGFHSSDGTPTSITFTGRLFGETELLAVSRAYQQATDFHLRRPPMEKLLES